MTDYRNAEGYCTGAQRNDYGGCAYRDGATRWTSWCNHRAIVTGVCLRDYRRDVKGEVVKRGNA